MKRTTVVSTEAAASTGVSGTEHDERPERGSLKLFFSYAPFTGTTTALLDEVQGMVARGRDVFLEEMSVPATGKHVGQPFDVDAVLKRRPDLVALDDFAIANPPGSRNKYRYQDALELLHAGIDVYAVLRVSSLQGERDRITLITGREPRCSVPDHLFYNAQQVEFVDIDPEELAERSAIAGRHQDELPVLRQLRALALECVSFYASASSEAKARQADVPPGASSSRDRVIALLSAGELPAPVLREAMRLAGTGHSPLQAVCISHDDRTGGPRDAQDGELAPEIARLKEQAEALSFEFVMLSGEDGLETLRNYLRVQNVSDLVVSQAGLARLMPRRVPLGRQRSFASYFAVRVHVVPGEASLAGARKGGVRRGVRALMDFRPSHLVVALLAVAAATALAVLFGVLGLGFVNVYLAYILAATLVATYTKSYLPTMLTVALSAVAEAIYLRPVFRIQAVASVYVTYAFMVAVLVVVTFAAVRMGRAAERAHRREQNTQALYELNRSLAYTHGILEVMDVSLDAVVRLFDRSAAFFVADPFDRSQRDGDRRSYAIREVQQDIGSGEFERINELNIAHWVFVNGSPAGAGTDTNATSDILYLPLKMDETVIGVIAISTLHPLDAGERSFLSMVCNRVLGALERQALAASHLRDMQNLQVGMFRAGFMGRFVGTVSLSANTIAEISRMMQATSEEDTLYRDELEQVIGSEALRARIMTDRLHAEIVDTPTQSTCDLRAVVAAAVETSRHGRGYTLVELEPGEHVPALVADGVMLRSALLFVLEGSLLFAPVGSSVRVSVHVHPEYVSVTVSDDRPDALAGSSAPFSRDYDAERARALLAFLSDRSLVTETGASATALARALRVPLGACSVDGKVDQRRLARVDRVQYGLYVAALIVRAHNGAIRTRHRLGGGAVTTITLPIE